MRELSIDIETYSSKDLTKSGVYAYANAPDFQILLFAYAFDDEEVRVIDIARGEKLPAMVKDALTDKNIRKTAYNANFERTCIAKYFNLILPPEQWQCNDLCRRAGNAAFAGAGRRSVRTVRTERQSRQGLYRLLLEAVQADKNQWGQNTKLA